MVDIILTFLLVVISAYNVSSIGQNRQFPFYAFLEAKNTTHKLACSGTLIGDQWVLTSADCVYKIDKITVYLGLANETSTLNGNNEIKVIETTTFHMYNNYFANRDIYNQGLIHLPEPIKSSATINPIALSCIDRLATDVDVIALGTAFVDGKLAPLKSIVLKTITPLRCRQIARPLFMWNAAYCAEKKDDNSIYIRNSGGPVIHPSDNTLLGQLIYRQEWENMYPLAFSNIERLDQWVTSVSGVKVSRCNQK